MIYGLGSNSSGQLGIGHKEDVSIPTKVQLPPGFEETRLRKVAAGGNHTLLLFEDNRLCSSGDDCDGRGLRNQQAQPVVNAFNEAVILGSGTTVPLLCLDAAATWEASCAVVLDTATRPSMDVPDVHKRHWIISCGTGLKGELGRPFEAEHASHATRVPQVPFGQQIVDIAAGMNHVAVVLSNGDVYGWGAGRSGQLGEPKQAVVDRPRKILGLRFPAQRVSCGKDFTFILGSPSTGEHLVLGSNKWNIVSGAPESVPNWKDVTASWGSIFLLLETGEVLSWGRNDHGQLCPPGIPSVEKLAAGSEHAVALTTEGKVIAWGWGEHGNCGVPVDDQGDVKGRWNELLVQGKPIEVGAGCATTFVSVVDTTSLTRSRE